MKMEISVFLIGVALMIVLLGCAGVSPRRTVLEKEGFLTASDGVRLYYKVKGNGPRKVIIPFATRFGDGDFDVLTKGRTIFYYDPRCRGHSETVELSGLSFVRDLQDLEEVRRFFGLRKFSLIGVNYFGALRPIPNLSRGLWSSIPCRLEESLFMITSRFLFPLSRYLTRRLRGGWP
jgi:hypothetical protein